MGGADDAVNCPRAMLVDAADIVVAVTGGVSSTLLRSEEEVVAGLDAAGEGFEAGAELELDDIVFERCAVVADLEGPRREAANAFLLINFLYSYFPESK